MAHFARLLLLLLGLIISTTRGYFGHTAVSPRKSLALSERGRAGSVRSQAAAAVPFSRRSLLSSGAGAGLVAASLVARPGASAAASAVPTGKAPAFELENSKGQGTTSLNQLLATKKWTVLYFYPGAFTSGCTLEARNFSRDYEEYKKLNAQIVGVSVDSVEKNAQFCDAENLEFYMLSDLGGQVSKMYGSALSVPGFGTFSNRQTYLINPEGVIKYVFTDVESHVARHSTEVLEKLRELEN
mmetsp:Transcript_4481/g.8555  ORF Transcript_4481/g.8555 Transcript_4481/m.8555 type:complete len:242 (-) Transcript_4481:24-749(-)